MSAKFPVFVFPGAASHGTGEAECGVQRHDGPCRGGRIIYISRLKLGGYGLDKKELLAIGRFEDFLNVSRTCSV